MNLPDVLAVSWAIVSATLPVIPIQLIHQPQSQESVLRVSCSTKDSVTSVQETVQLARLQPQPVPDVKSDFTSNLRPLFAQPAQSDAKLAPL